MPPKGRRGFPPPVWCARTTETEVPMANYDVQHTCGHTVAHQLYGPTVDRKRKITWLKSQSCGACWNKAKHAEDDAAGPLVTVRVISGSDGNRALEIIATRSTFGIKDLLKERGYKFGEFTIGNGFLDLAARGEKGWHLICQGPAAAEQYCGEIAWIQAQGWELMVQEQASTMFASLAEGRPE